jgi:hypothetical protein
MKSLLFVEKRSRQETASELRVNSATIKNVLEKMPGAKSPPWKLSPTLIEERRAKWLVAVKQNPDLSRNQLRNTIGNVVYDTLRRYDPEWLNLHSPPKRKPVGPTTFTNWPQKDEQLAAKVNDIVAGIMQTPGRPIRSSATRIARRLGVLDVLYKRHPDCLPLTRAAITEVAEDIYDFAIRRLQWAVAAFKADSFVFNASQLKGRAALSITVGEHPKVAAVIQTLVYDQVHSSITERTNG